MQAKMYVYILWVFSFLNTCIPFKREHDVHNTHALEVVLEMSLHTVQNFC